MAINKTYPLEALLGACKEFQEKAPCATKRISFEYVLLKDVNDAPSHAHALAKLIKKYKFYCHVNLIPFNPWPSSIYQASETVDQFRSALLKFKIPVTVRRSRGQDIMAACGQLKTASQG
jgi:23S rRNA (adenine2503-C2)-methyltransferase